MIRVGQMRLPVIILVILILYHRTLVKSELQFDWPDSLTAIPDDQGKKWESTRRHLAADHIADMKNETMQCKISYEPTCEMYNYVRFWNKRFHPADCYESPLRPGAKAKTPWNEKKYVVFQPDVGGWNNIRMGAETVILFAHATGRTLVMPPTMKFYLLNLNKKEEDNESSFQKFFDFSKLAEALDIVSMDDFVEHVAKPGLLLQPFPNNMTVSPSPSFWKYMENACSTYDW